MFINVTTANQLLANAEMNESLDEKRLAHIFETTSPQLFVDALRKAASDSGAKTWLSNALNNARRNYRKDTPRPAQQTSSPAKENAAVETTETNQQAQSPVSTRQPSNKENKPPASDPNKETREYRGYKVFGRKSAFYVGIDETRSGTPTLRFEGAVAVAEKQYNWGEKISIQLTQQELPHVACVLFGWLPECEYKNHGPAKNKGFKLIIQSNNGKTGLFVNLMEANKPMCAIPVSSVDLYYLRNLALGQLVKNEPDLDSTAILASLKTYAKMLNS